MPRLLRLTLVLVLLIASSRPAFSQRKLAAPALIMQFLYALYQTPQDPQDPQDPQQLARQYVALKPGKSEWSEAKRYDFAASHLNAIRQDTSMWADGRRPGHFDTARYQVRPLAAVLASSPGFVPNFILDDKQQRNVYALIKGKKPVQYFVVEDTKISSFAYMTKGTNGLAYFFRY